MAPGRRAHDPFEKFRLRENHSPMTVIVPARDIVYRLEKHSRQAAIDAPNGLTFSLRPKSRQLSQELRIMPQ
ncbi:MAG: hypothetical protein WCK86_01610 [Planctomycetia bacterium]